MANKTVSNLNELTTVSNSDVLLVETATETFKVTKGNLLKEVNQQLNAKSDADHTHDEYATKTELNIKVAENTDKITALSEGVINKITQSQYDNLSAAEKENKMFAIIDAREPYSLSLVGNTLSLMKNNVAVSSVVIPTVSGENATINVTNISLEPTTHTMKIDETLQLKVTITPSNASNTNVVWESLNPTIATVENGFVTARGVGNTTIKVTSADGNKTATCQLTVNAKDEAVSPPTTEATLIHAYNFEDSVNDVVNSFHLDENRKVTRDSNLLVDRYDSFSVKFTGTFTNQYKHGMFSSYPKEGENITSTHSPTHGRFQVCRDISYGSATGKVVLEHYDATNVKVGDITTDGNIPKNATATVIITYDKTLNEANIYVDGVNVYTENKTLNLDGISVDSSVDRLEIYKGVIEVGE